MYKLRKTNRIGQIKQAIRKVDIFLGGGKERKGMQLIQENVYRVMEPCRRGQQGDRPEPFRGWGGWGAGARAGADDCRGEVGGWRCPMVERLFMEQLDPQGKHPALRPSACSASLESEDLFSRGITGQCLWIEGH